MNSRNLAVCEHRDGPEGVAEWPKPGRERQTRGRRPGPRHHGTGPSVQRLHAHVTQRHSTDHDRRGAAGLRPTSPSVGWTVAPSARAVRLATRARHGEAGSAPCKCKVQRARGWAGRGWRRSGSAPGREQKPRAGFASAPRAAGAAAAAHVSAPGDSERAGTHGARARARHALCQDARERTSTQQGARDGRPRSRYSRRSTRDNCSVITGPAAGLSLRPGHRPNPLGAHRARCPPRTSERLPTDAGPHHQ